MARSLGLFLLPIYTTYLSPADYGKFSILGIILDMSMLLLGLQLPQAVYKFWADARDRNEQRQIIGTVMWLSVVLSTLIFIPVYLWAEGFVTILGLPGDAHLLRLILFESQLGLIVGVIMAEMRACDASTKFALWEVLQTLSMGLLSVVLVSIFGWGLWGMFGGQVLVLLAMCCILFPSFIKRNKFIINKVLCRQLLGYSLPLIPAGVAMTALHMADRFFLQHMVGIDITGLYAIGYKFGMIVNVIVTGPFFLIWHPRRFIIAQKQNASVEFGEIFTYVLIASSTVALALTGMRHEIVELMTAPQYIESVSVVPLVAWGYVLFTLSSVVNVGLFVHKKTGIFLWITILAFGVNCIGNYFLILRFGHNGAALSTLVSFFMFFLLNWLFAKKYMSIAFEWKKIVQLGILVVGATWGMAQVSSHSLIISILGKVLILSLFLFAMFRIGFFVRMRLGERAKTLLPWLQ